MNLILLVLYEIMLCLITILAIPKTIYSFFVHKKYHNSLLQRLGYQFPTLAPDSLPSIWVHAVSVGETKAIVPLARALKQRFPDHPLIISSVSETGHAEAMRSLPFADNHVYLPFDFSWLVSKTIKKTSPALFILCESDFWFNFLYFAKKSGAKLALVNGKLSERSKTRFSLVPFFSKKMFDLFDVLCVQNELYRARFLEAGAPLQRIVVTGNLKLDGEYPHLTEEEVIEWRKKLGIGSGKKVLTIGSIHLSEEKYLLPILKRIWQHVPALQVILVPRRPEQFKAMGEILEKECIPWINYSEIIHCKGDEKVILVDTMGLLRMCYQLSDIALVGGSYADHVGGHNILEPCWYGKPVLFGPHMYSQPELLELILKYKAGIQVGQEELEAILMQWLSHPEECEEFGKRGLELVKDLKGSVQRTFFAIEPLFESLKKGKKENI